MYRCYKLLPVLLLGSERGCDHASFAVSVLSDASGCLALCRVLLSALAVIMNICRQLQLQLFTAALGGLPRSLLSVFTLATATSTTYECASIGFSTQGSQPNESLCLCVHVAEGCPRFSAVQHHLVWLLVWRSRVCRIQLSIQALARCALTLRGRLQRPVCQVLCFV
jgi:hypothetical protein